MNKLFLTALVGAVIALPSCRHLDCTKKHTETPVSTTEVIEVVATPEESLNQEAPAE